MSDAQKQQIIFYKTAKNTISIEVFLQDETLWLSQKKIAELFGVVENNITYHIKEIYNSWELEQWPTAQKIWVVQNEWWRQVKRQIDSYNLDMIIAVGYRINSKQATQFRIRATNILKEYIIKWFVMDDERLKNGKHFGKDYYEELLERIKEIRASERRFYQKITDIYATAVDYDKDSDLTKLFFATVQNKLHYAITGNTASEIIYNRADSSQNNMWLTSWKTSPDGKIIKTDVSIAKNYLTEEEIKKLNILVNAYLDLAEVFAMDQIPMTMKDRKERLDEFLKLSRKDILEWAGKITAQLAKEKAEEEYQTFRPLQDQNYLSDFDNFAQEVKKKPQKVF